MPEQSLGDVNRTPRWSRKRIGWVLAISYLIAVAGIVSGVWELIAFGFFWCGICTGEVVR